MRASVACHGQVSDNPKQLLPLATGGFLALHLPMVILGNAVLSASLQDPAKDIVQNAPEWWGGAIFVAVFLALAAIWRCCGLRLHLAGR